MADGQLDNKTIIIIQARMSSKRLHNKAMLVLLDKPILQWVIERVKLSKFYDNIVVATSNCKEDDIIQWFCDHLRIDCYRGSLRDVRSRFIEIGKQYHANIIVRVTADNPFTEPIYIDQLLRFIYENKKVNYVRMKPTEICYGSGAEVFRFNEFKNSAEKYKSNYDKEHVTPCIIKSSDNIYELSPDLHIKNSLSVTIDTFEDYYKLSKYLNEVSDTSNLLEILSKQI